MKQITRLRGIALKLSPPIDVTIKRRCLEASHINSAHAHLNRDDGGLLPLRMCNAAGTQFNSYNSFKIKTIVLIQNNDFEKKW